MRYTTTLAVILAAALPCSSQTPPARLPASAFAYDAALPLAVQEIGVETRDGVEIHDITFAGSTGRRTAAYRVTAPGARNTAGILFVHWYAQEPDANRTQYLAEAVALARRGATSLLIETMWSAPGWFEHRDPAGDYANSLQQVKDLRRALDVLLADASVDRHRTAFVGHDFGAMYGAVLAGVEGGRVQAWVLEAGTSSFSDWFLLGAKLTPGERQGVIHRLAPLDPTRYISAAAPAPVLFQFARHDPYVPERSAREFSEAAGTPKTTLWYDAGHGLNAQAADDRRAWLARQLHLK